MTTELVASAKVTLSLRVTGLRTDGYHLIDAEMVTVDLHDTLRVDAAGSDISVVGLDAGVVLGSDNLVARALSVADRRAGVAITKRIPAGAGLGGGSADAAAILRWAGISDLAVAASLGADVPFCTVGGRARVTGIGECVEPLPYQPRVLTLITPNFRCSTYEVYAMWDHLDGPTGDHHNDLEPAALAVEPRLEKVRDRIIAETGIRPRLAGSGSTWFLEGAHAVEGGIVVATTAAPA